MSASPQQPHAERPESTEHSAPDPDPDLTEGERAFIDFLIAQAIQRLTTIPLDDVATSVTT